jgi:hypothetical protein
MDYHELVLGAYKDALTRVRWALITTTLISGLFGVTLYLDYLGLDRPVLQAVLKEELVARVTSKDARVDDQSKILPHGFNASLVAEDDLVAKLAIDDNTIQDGKKELNARLEASSVASALDLFARDKYRLLTHAHALQQLSASDRQLPIINYSVSSVDYLPVLMMLLFVFVGVTWLSIGAVRSNVEALSEEVSFLEVRKAARVYLSFMYPTASGRGGQVNKFLLTGAVWLPVCTMGVFLYHEWVLVHSWGHVTGVWESVRLIAVKRVVVHVFVEVLMFSAAISGSRSIQVVEHIMYGPQGYVQANKQQTAALSPAQARADAGS